MSVIRNLEEVSGTWEERGRERKTLRKRERERERDVR